MRTKLYVDVDQPARTTKQQIRAVGAHWVRIVPPRRPRKHSTGSRRRPQRSGYCTVRPNSILRCVSQPAEAQRRARPNAREKSPWASEPGQRFAVNCHFKLPHGSTGPSVKEFLEIEPNKPNQRQLSLSSGAAGSRLISIAFIFDTLICC